MDSNMWSQSMWERRSVRNLDPRGDILLETIRQGQELTDTYNSLVEAGSHTPDKNAYKGRIPFNTADLRALIMKREDNMASANVSDTEKESEESQEVESDSSSNDEVTIITKTASTAATTPTRRSLIKVRGPRSSSAGQRWVSPPSPYSPVKALKAICSGSTSSIPHELQRDRSESKAPLPLFKPVALVQSSSKNSLAGGDMEKPAEKSSSETKKFLSKMDEQSESKSDSISKERIENLLNTRRPSSNSQDQGHTNLNRSGSAGSNYGQRRDGTVWPVMQSPQCNWQMQPHQAYQCYNGGIRLCCNPTNNYNNWRPSTTPSPDFQAGYRLAQFQQQSHGTSFQIRQQQVGGLSFFNHHYLQHGNQSGIQQMRAFIGRPHPPPPHPGLYSGVTYSSYSK